MLNFNAVKIPLQKITDPVISSSGVNLYMLRLDKTHPDISGNKWYKLKYNLEEAKRLNKDTLLTFGGAFSNHIVATAAAGKESGIKTIGVIRGEELSGSENPTLRFTKDCGMQLHFVSREDYRKKDSPEFIQFLIQTFGDFYLIPEGGANALAIKGCIEITSLIDISFDYVCCACGTGGTLAGITISLKENQQAVGFSVLNAPGYHASEVKKWLSHFQIDKFSNPPAGRAGFQIGEDYHFGGYGKYTPELLKFISDFEDRNDIPLDQVYTGKMMYGVFDLIRKNYFSKNSTVIAIHTGGLQGRMPRP